MLLGDQGGEKTSFVSTLIVNNTSKDLMDLLSDPSSTTRDGVDLSIFITHIREGYTGSWFTQKYGSSTNRTRHWILGWSHLSCHLVFSGKRQALRKYISHRRQFRGVEGFRACYAIPSKWAPRYVAPAESRLSGASKTTTDSYLDKSITVSRNA